MARRADDERKKSGLSIRSRLHELLSAPWIVGALLLYIVEEHWTNARNTAEPSQASGGERRAGEQNSYAAE